MVESLSSILTPPLSETNIDIPPLVRSREIDKYISRLKKVRSTTYTNSHLLPYSPVCLVIRVLFNILSAYNFASSAELAI